MNILKNFIRPIKKKFYSSLERKNNIILTGILRAGTTLTCKLLSNLPNVVVLQEPIFESDTNNTKIIINEIKQFLNKSRQEILTSKICLTYNIDGHPTDNYLTNNIIDGKRVYVDGCRSYVSIDKPLTKYFYLIVKRPSLFTALLPHLIKDYQCYAIIRNPLSILASWETTPFNVSEGYAPKAEQFDTNLKKSLNTIETKRERQLHLINWFFTQYKTYLKSNEIIKYEDIIKTNGKILSSIVPNANGLETQLISKNSNSVYNRETLQSIAERLLAQHHASYWDFYDKNDIEKVLQDYNLQ